MLRSFSVPFVFATCVVALTFPGCAKMFSSNLGELVSQPDVQSDLVDRSKADVSEFKVDPLALARDTPKSTDNSTPSEWGLVRRLPDLKDGNDRTMDELAATSTSKPIIRLETLKKKPDNQFRPADNVVAVADFSPAEHPLAPISSPKVELIDAVVPTTHLPKTADDSNALLAPNPIKKMLEKRPLESLPEIPVAVVPESDNVVEAVDEMDAPVIPEINVVDPTFVSSQMEMMVPPFANHPEPEVCEYSDCDLPVQLPPKFEPKNDFAAPRSTATHKPSEFRPSSNKNHIGELNNDFVEQLISSSINPEPNRESNAPFELTNNNSSPNAAVSATVEMPATWNGQLEKAILAFENEIQNPIAAVNLNELSRGLAILRSLESSLVVENDDDQTALEEYWLHQLKALNSIMESNSSNYPIGTTTAEALSHLNRAADQLRESANLKLLAPSFCRKVSGFGQYETFETTDFKSDQRVLVYCEIENFTPTMELDDGVENFQTQISSSYEITNSNDQIVQSTKFPTVTDNARNVRNDFFMHLPIQFADLKQGDYQLQVEVRDHGSGKTASLVEPLRFKVR